MGAESGVVLGAEATNFIFEDGTCKSRRIMAFGTYHGASVIKRMAFD
jgi:hypothetical protein